MIYFALILISIVFTQLLGTYLDSDLNELIQIRNNGHFKYTVCMLFVSGMEKCRLCAAIVNPSQSKNYSRKIILSVINKLFEPKISDCPCLQNSVCQGCFNKFRRVICKQKISKNTWERVFESFNLPGIVSRPIGCTKCGIRR